jgi:phage repressor protein C with HTH and peptisase S24 domain
MSIIDQREALERLIRDRREDYAGLSRLLGRNASYIQQFVKRGSPRRLDHEDVLKLAEYFGVAPAVLGARGTSAEDQLVRVPRYDIGASAGHGAFHESEQLVSHIAFERSWLRQLCGTISASLAFIKVQGDSMSPTLSDGDDILVDESDGAARIRDGIYVLRRDDSLMVKRIAVSPTGRHATIKSDNPSYPEWRDCDLAGLQIIGRVVWAGRKVS